MTLRVTIDNVRHARGRCRLEVRANPDGSGTLAVKPYGVTTTYTASLEEVAQLVLDKTKRRLEEVRCSPPSK